MSSEKIKNILRPYCHKIIPLIYDDSLSYYEVLCKLTAKINEVIDKVNINADIQQYVDEILREWLEDGTIAALVNNNVEQETVIHPEYISTFSYSSGARQGDSTPSFDVIQSFCMINSNTAVGVRGQRNPEDEAVKLFKFNLETGIATTGDYTVDGGHANDICFDGQYIYITWMRENDGNVATNKVTVCDTNLNYVETITVPVTQVDAMDYNPTEERFFVYDSDKVYIFNKQLNTIIKTINLDFSYYRHYYNYDSRFAAQTITCLENAFLITYAYPNVVFKFNYCGDILKIYNMTDYYDNGFNTLEMEKIVYNRSDGWYYLMSFSVQGLGDYANNTFGRFNLEKGQVYNICVNATTRPNYYTSTQRIYVSETVAMNAKMLGTYQFPFRFLQQAIDCKRMMDNPATIVVLHPNTATDLGTICMSDMSNIRISIYPEEPIPTNTNYFIPQAQIINCSNIQIFYMNIQTMTVGNSVGVIFGRLRCNFAWIPYSQAVMFSNYVTINTLQVNNTWIADYSNDTNSIGTVLGEESYNSYEYSGTNIELL